MFQKISVIALQPVKNIFFLLNQKIKREDPLAYSLRMTERKAYENFGTLFISPLTSLSSSTP